MARHSAGLEVRLLVTDRTTHRWQPVPVGTALLEVRDIAVRLGGIVALDGVSFDLEEGQILGLIGPNGAGKTTLFNCLSRLYTPNRGEILFEGSSLLHRPPHRIAEIGIARTFQNLALFPRQSVLDNVRIGAHTACRSDFVSDALRLPWVRRQERALEQTAWALLETLDLREVAQERRLVGEVQGDPPVGAGQGEMVLIVQGSSARLTPETEKLPVDATIIGIVDSVNAESRTLFSARA